MLHRSTTANLYFNSSDVLLTAKHMINGHSIRQVEQDLISYHHILFDEHQIVFAEGAPSESFHPGQMGLRALDDRTREDLFAKFPSLRSDPNSYGDTARECLRAYEAKLLTTEPVQMAA